MKKTINIVDIDQSDLSTLAQVRNLKVNGDIGSVFMVNVIKVNGTGKESYYNFKSKTFTNNFNVENNLNVTLITNDFVKPMPIIDGSPNRIKL